MEPSTELVGKLLSLYQAIRMGDLSLVEQNHSHQAGLLVIGTDPGEWYSGYEATIAMYRTQVKEMSGGGVAIFAGEPQAFVEGTVGWVADRPKFCLPDGKEVSCRFTGVWHREDGEWKLVQHHISIGVPNEQAVGQTLTV